MKHSNIPKLGKDLKKLSKMLNRKENSAFESNLRNQLLNHAQTMKQKKTKSRMSWNFLNHLNIKWALMPVTAIALILVVIINAGLPGGGSSVVRLANISEAKAYYTLEAVGEDETGIDKNTEFILKSEGEIKAVQVEKNLKITPETEVVVTQKDENTIIIDPVNSLEKGEVYAIALEAQNMEDSPYKREYSWAYQVSDDFKILSTIPGNHQSMVPINTGIEIHVSDYGVGPENFGNSFTITPAAKGNFKVDGRTLIFIPSEELQKETIYKVTLSKTLTASDEEGSLTEDYSFSFETSGADYYNTNLRISEKYYESSPDEEPILTMSYYDRNKSDQNPMVNILVYRYDTGEDYLKAVEKEESDIPSWTYYARYKNKISTEGLTKVLESKDVQMMEDRYGQKILTIPNKLSKGHYLVEVSLNDESEQAFMQVTDLAVQIDLNPSKPFIWINDLKTGKPVKGAKATMLKYNESATSDISGLAEFKGLPGVPEEERGDSGFMKIEAEGETVYYYAPFYEMNTVNDFYQYLETDRNVYHPTDKIYFWGFLQGRDKNKLNGQTKVVIFDKHNYLSIGRKISENEKEAILYSQDMQIKDGEVFEGEFNVKKLLPDFVGGDIGFYAASYSLAVLMEDRAIAVASFNVDEFTKPAYEISMEAEKTALYNGESTNINITASFFDGTKVSDTELVYNEGYGRKEAQLKTDGLGETDVELKAKMDNCNYEDLDHPGCSLFDNYYLSVRPKREELADIQGSESVKAVRSGIALVADEPTYEKITLETRKVDLQKIEESEYAYEGNKELFPDVAPNAKVDLIIEKKNIRRTESGEYYDPVTKVVQKTYTTETYYTLVKTETLVSDSEGKIEHPLNLDEESGYRISVRTYDEQGRSYIRQFYLYEGQGIYNQYYLLEFTDDKAVYRPGDTVNVKITYAAGLSDEEWAKNQYIFMYGQEDIKKIVVTDKPELEIPFTKDSIPNLSIEAYVFNGHQYQNVDRVIAPFDKESRRLEIEVKADKEEYEPGKKVKLEIQSKDKETGHPVSSTVNVYLVDEAYYAIYSEDFSDPLNAIYSNVYTQRGYSDSTHEKAMMMNGGMGGCFTAGTKILMADGSYKNIEDIVKGDKIMTRISPLSDELTGGFVTGLQEHIINEYLLINGFLGVTPEHIIFLNGQFEVAGKAKVGDYLLNDKGESVIIESIEEIHETASVYNFEVNKYHTYFADGVYVHNDKGDARQDFLDTALFETVDTDTSGKAFIEFDLPDNITSWRVAVGAIKGGADIYAGYGNAKIPVSKDIFALPLINPEYLLEDKPSVPVRAFGDALQTGQTVLYSMASETLDYEEDVSGEAFQNTYFDLTNLRIGEHKITSTVSADRNLDIPEPEEIGDIIILPTEVKETHMTENVEWDTILTPNIVLQGSPEDRTEFFFMNNETRPVYSALIRFLYLDLERADVRAAGSTSRTWMNEYLDEKYPEQDIKTELFQTAGGISVVPYGDAKLDFSAQLTAVNPDLWDKGRLKEYFSNKLESPDSSLSEKIQSLYGLSGLGIYKLPMLNYFMKEEELSQKLTIEDKIYAALTYITYGAKNKAEELFIEIMESSEEVFGGSIKVTSKGVSSHDEYSWTALTAAIASELDSSKQDALWEYASGGGYRGEDLIVNEKMIFIKSRLKKGINTTVSFKVNGTLVELKKWDCFKLNLLPEELSGQKFEAVNGEVYVRANYKQKAELKSFETDNRIKVERKYLVNGQQTTVFRSGDVVEVHITITVPTALSGAYQIRDYLPSGLKIATAAGVSGYRKDDYRYPYEVDMQEADFYQYCGDQESKEDARCDSGKTFYYFARVINKGSFVAEPAVLQSLKDENVLNLSATEKQQIQIQ